MDAEAVRLFRATQKQPRTNTQHVILNSW